MICPKCGVEIPNLIGTGVGSKGVFEFPLYDAEMAESMKLVAPKAYFTCPVCEKKLASNYEEAEELFNG